MGISLSAKGVTRQQNKKLLPIITVCFDDAFPCMYNLMFPNLVKLGVRGSFFINAYDIEKGYTTLTRENLKEMSDKGMEIASHGYRHIHEGEIATEEEILSQYHTNIKFIESVTGKKIYSHAYPYGNYDERVLRIVQGIFEGARSTVAYQPYGEGAFAFGDTRRYEVPGIACEMDRFEFLKGRIDNFLKSCEDEPMWLNMYWHRIVADDDPEPNGKQTESEFRQVIEYLVSLREQGKIEILPYYEANRKIQTAISYRLL